MLDGQSACLNDAGRLLPVMLAEVHIQTGALWSHVMKPPSDQINRMFRE